MTNLTEQWKKGELPNGMYYIQFKDGDIVKDVYAFGSWGNINEHFLKQVLEQVPSYEKWDKLNNTCHELEKETACLTVDIVNLKELLKECHSFIEDYDNKKLLTKIDEALK